jgi:hypothetical protein
LELKSADNDDRAVNDGCTRVRARRRSKNDEHKQKIARLDPRCPARLRQPDEAPPREQSEAEALRKSRCEPVPPRRCVAILAYRKRKKQRREENKEDPKAKREA